MRYVIGVDDGQNGTTAVIADEEGCLLGIGHSSAFHPAHASDGNERFRHALTEALHGALARADLENARIACACLSLTNDDEPRRALCESVVPADCLLFGAETRLALYTVTLGRPGAVVIAGMGAAAYGRNASGEQATASGWGHLIGNEGSGYWIALRALNACCRAHDGLAPPTQLLSCLLHHFEALDLAHLHRILYSGSLTRPDIAALSEVVGRAAAQGDATARRILRDAGKELALSVNAVLARLCLERGPVVVGTVGGVFRSGRLVLRAFREVVKRVAPDASILPAQVSPAVGAALMALEEIGVTLSDSLLTKVEATLPHLSLAKL